ncbi:hypothetical protein AOLI_G00029900 [Acnodon oligacanthus]
MPPVGTAHGPPAPGKRLRTDQRGFFKASEEASTEAKAKLAREAPRLWKVNKVQDCWTACLTHLLCCCPMAHRYVCHAYSAASELLSVCGSEAVLAARVNLAVICAGSFFFYRSSRDITPATAHRAREQLNYVLWGWMKCKVFPAP